MVESAAGGRDLPSDVVGECSPTGVCADVGIESGGAGDLGSAARASGRPRRDRRVPGWLRDFDVG